MARQSLLTALTVSLMLFLSLADCWGRGFGGGGRGGGAGGGGLGGGGARGGGLGGVGHSPGGLGGGGFGGGGAGHSPAGFGGAGRSPGGLGGGGFGGGAGHSPSGLGGGGFAGGGAGHSPGGFGGGQRGGAGFGGGLPGGGGVGGPGAAGPGGGHVGGAGLGGARGGAGGIGQGGPGAFGDRGPGSQGPGGDRFSPPSRGQLNNFLGLPSDEGLHNLGSAGVGRGNVGVGGDLGIGGGRPGAGPGGVGGVGIGGDVGIGGGRPGVGAGGVGRPGVGAGGAGRPGVGAAGVGRPGVGAGGVGRPGVGAGGVGGFAPVSASARYTSATAVRTNYNHWGVYSRDWYARYPGAWFPAGWPDGAAWRACTWDAAASYCGYYQATPLYYDYGNNVTYQDNSVYVNGDNVGTAEQYYDQAASLASTNAAAEAASDGDWLPLGVFALARPDQTKSDVSIQLAVNKQGVIRGNYTDTVTNKNQAVQGSVDKQTQRVAFTVGENKTNVVETGLYNLTKDEAPCLIHFGNQRTQQWLLVRLQKPNATGN